MAKDQVLYAHLNLAGSTVGANSLARQSQEKAPGNESEDTWQDVPSQQKPENEWWYEVIKLKEAQASMPKEFVKVAVVDDGFDTTHPDLNLAYISKEQENMSAPQEHGTHVAGIVQQIMPGAQITVLDSYRYPGKVEMGQYARQCHHLKFLVDLVEADMKVINYSMGSDIPLDANIAWDVESSSIFSVYIWLLKKLGKVFILVQSAGNSGLDAYRNGYLSTLNAENCLGSDVVRKSLGVSERIEAAQKEVFDSIVLVGASGKKDSSGRYPLLLASNYGESVTIVAPGDYVRSTVPGGYDLMGGTSQSAPVVAGGLGFLWSLDKTLTSDQLKQILIKSSTEVAHDLVEGRPADKRQTYPIFNLLEAVKFVLKDG
ncbi:MAG: S8/S53 family peptidase [Chloroflexi bacterium]|nr:S8/S53 family peptidase [Chloroflexota bacterium]